MDIQSQVAARRAELARQTEEAARAQKAATAKRLQQEREERSAALEDVARELNAAGTPIEKHGDELIIAEESPLLHLDPEDIKRDALKSLLAKEARQRWTTAENWVVIGAITSGLLLLIPIFPLGALLLVVGFGYGYQLKDRYQHRLIAEFPRLFGQFKVEPRTK